MTSTSMALNGHGWTLDRLLYLFINCNFFLSEPINPGLLNNWLKQVGGYVSGSELDNPIICKLDSPYCTWNGFGSSSYRYFNLLWNK